jgi:hypothetical protein
MTHRFAIIAASLIGLAGALPSMAHAEGFGDRFGDSRRDRHDIYADRRDIAQDEARLRYDEWTGNWFAVRRDIEDLRADRRDVAHDARDVHRNFADRRDFGRGGDDER